MGMINMAFKACIKCNNILPVTNEYFREGKECKDGFGNVCKACISKQSKQHRLATKEKCKNYREQYNITNKKSIAEQRKQHYNENREVLIEKSKEYQRNNKESTIKRMKQWRVDNLKYSYEYAKQYRKEHLEQNRFRCQRYFSKKRSLPSTLTNLQWISIKEHFNNRCAYCGKELPLAQDHFIPLSKDGEYTVNNIICACRSCNSSKSNKDFSEWYPKYKYYSKQREKDILKFLRYENNSQQLTLTI